ncbi:hypothetical protein [Streptomyces sp. MK5]|uniref:hypothetical protein n=1 Tax=Streptomyces sp. MK5 TaxID=3064253 RepID=UPI002740DD41|nr:hypothetical protein [Streptomyces sp. MK5]
MGAYGHDITAGMLVFDREDFTAYQPGSEPVWLVEKVAGHEERSPGDTTVYSTYAHLRNAEVHGKNTTPSNSGWSATKPVGRLVEAADEDDHTKRGTFRMDRAMVAFLRATRFRGSTSDDYPTVRDLVNAAPYDRHGFLVGARPVTPHGLRYELGALSVCLGNLFCDLEAGRITAADLEAGGISVPLLEATREALRTAESAVRA